MAHRKTLTAGQLELLKWIEAGSPGGVVEGESYKISAAALRNRGLVTVTGRGPSWKARITPRGVEHLRAANDPKAPAPRQGKESVTDALVAAVVAADGPLRVPQASYGRPGQVDWERRVRLAELHGKVPPGRRFKVTRAAHDELLIELIDAPDGTVLPLRPVPVPGRVSRPHPAVSGYREIADQLQISSGALPRVCRLLQAIAVEAEQRRFTVTSASAPILDQHRRMPAGSVAKGHPAISMDGLVVSVDFTEEGLTNWHTWAQKRTTYSWTGGRSVEKRPRRSEYEATATGRLSIALPTRYRGPARQATWSDGRKGSLEDQLPEVLRELEVRVAEHRHEAREAELAAEKRQREWELAMDEACQAHAEHHREEVLRDQVSRWTETQMIRAYCDAAEAAHGEDGETIEWLAWARRHAERLDPLRTPPSGPVTVAPTPEALRPFLGGVDANGPRR